MKFWMAYRFLTGNVLRAVFPLISVVTAATALVLTISLGDAAKNIIDSDLAAIGGNKILIGGGRLSKRDLQLIERLPFVEYAVFPEEREVENNVIFRGYSERALRAMGLPNLKIEEVVLDKTQFLDKSVGEKIQLQIGVGRKNFLVRDLYEEKSPFETMKVGNRVILSGETFEKTFGRKDYKSLIISFSQGEEAMEYVPVILLELNKFRSKEEQVRVLETPDIYRKVERIRGFVSKSLFILSFIALGVGGIGVVNLIVSSIRERGTHIGILRAMGVNKKVLKEIFLIEAAIVVGLGTILGLVAGIGGAYVIGGILKIPPYFNFVKIIGGLIFTVGVGLGCGVYPVRKIGELEIVEALKI